jgi:phosphoglycerate dehydrogenase-like enzyme
MPSVLRWGRSAYETDLDLSLERKDAESLGLSWAHIPELGLPAGLEHTNVLVVNSGVQVDAAALDRLHGDLVITTTSGTDHIDVHAANTRNIQICRCPEARRDAVVDTTLAGLLGLFRELPRLHGAATRGDWARDRLPTIGPVLLQERTIAVLGARGVIGTEVCRKLVALGTHVIAVDPRGTDQDLPHVPLNDALEQADALTIHCHLTPKTRGLVDGTALDRLGPGGVVINTARGPILDIAAAVKRVEDGRLRGLLVDVFPTEPYPLLARDSGIEGVWFTPHAAGYTPELGARVAVGVGQILRAYMAGKPLPHRVLHH